MHQALAHRPRRVQIAERCQEHPPPELQCGLHAGAAARSDARSGRASALRAVSRRGDRMWTARHAARERVARNGFSLPVQRWRRGPEVDLGSILRTEAVRSFPEPEREIISMRDSDGGMKPGELPGPARERAASEKVVLRVERAVAGRRVVAWPRQVEGDGTARRRTEIGRLEIDDPRADLDRLEVRGRDRTE